MPNIIQSLFRVDPTDGLVEYVKAVKPYHTKILDVLVEYVYKENITTTVTDNWLWAIGLSNAQRDLVRECGWGWNWDLVPTADSILTSRIISAHTDTTQQNYFLVEPATSSQVTSDQIVGVVTGSNGSWTLAGNVTAHYSDDEVFSVMGNADSASNTVYTVSGVTFNGTNTVVNVLNGIPASATASGTVPFSTLKDYAFIVTSEVASQLTLVSPYTISAVDSVARAWTTSSPIAETLHAGDFIYVTNNTIASGQDSNGKYTVVSTAPESSGTKVYVQEYITPLVMADGTLSVTLAPEACPSWPVGTAIQVGPRPNTISTLPSPLSATAQYFFEPTDKIGTFSISTKRYAMDYTDYVHVSNVGVGVFMIDRVEQYLPGSYVHVVSSVSQPNNQTYGVVSTVRDGNNYRVYVREQIPVATPAGLQFDGILTQKQPTSPGYMPIFGWESPICPPAQSSDLFTDTVIRERFTLEWTISLSDYMTSSVVENNAQGFDYTTTSIVPANIITPTGIDTQPFDVGGM